MNTESKPPDPIDAYRVISEVVSRLRELSAFFENACKKEKRLAVWKERQVRGFLRYLSLQAKDLSDRYPTGRIDLIAQAMRNITELNVWVRYCELSPEDGKRFFDDGYRDMRDMTEALRKLDTGSNTEPKKMVEDLLVDLKAKAPGFGIDDYEAAYLRVNEAAGRVGTQTQDAVYYKIASKFAHPTALLLFRSDVSEKEMCDALYGVGVTSAAESFHHLKEIVKTAYADFIP